MTCYCDYDPPTWITVRAVKAARKQHRCIECRAPIWAGESYEYVSGLWGGDHSEYHICNRCVELREWAIISVPCFCWYYGMLHENVHEMVREVAYTTPGMFMEFGRRMIRIQQEKKKRGN